MFLACTPHMLAPLLCMLATTHQNHYLSKTQENNKRNQKLISIISLSEFAKFVRKMLKIS